jgi:hypothetical protein
MELDLSKTFVLPGVRAFQSRVILSGITVASATGMESKNPVFKRRRRMRNPRQQMQMARPFPSSTFPIRLLGVLRLHYSVAMTLDKNNVVMITRASSTPFRTAAFPLRNSAQNDLASRDVIYAQKNHIRVLEIFRMTEECAHSNSIIIA